MRTLHPAMILATALLVLTTAGCDTSPTATDDLLSTALFSASSQSRIALCHRTGSGDYTKITVADAAYDTHMAHGDRAVGENGDCPAGGMARLEVAFDVDPSGWWPAVGVVLHAPGEQETVLASCEMLTTCTYDVPTGSTIVLLSGSNYLYTWSEATCTGSNICVMDGDRSVVASAPVYEY
jgi:hypothetical protein